MGRYRFAQLGDASRSRHVLSQRTLTSSDAGKSICWVCLDGSRSITCSSPGTAQKATVAEKDKASMLADFPSRLYCPSVLGMSLPRKIHSSGEEKFGYRKRAIRRCRLEIRQCRLEIRRCVRNPPVYVGNPPVCEKSAGVC